jgi:hypothetical protein
VKSEASVDGENRLSRPLLEHFHRRPAHTDIDYSDAPRPAQRKSPKDSRVAIYWYRTVRCTKKLASEHGSASVYKKIREPA